MLRIFATSDRERLPCLNSLRKTAIGQQALARSFTMRITIMATSPGMSRFALRTTSFRWLRLLGKIRSRAWLCGKSRQSEGLARIARKFCLDSIHKLRPAMGAQQQADSQHKDGKNARQAAQWLEEKANEDKPFFIALGIHKPHVAFWLLKIFRYVSDRRNCLRG